MKKRTLLSGFALAFLITLGIAGTAQASDYNGDCAGLANWSTMDGNGNAIATDSSCTVSGPVTATGYIHIFTTGALTTDNLTSSGNEVIISANGSVTTKDVTSTSAMPATIRIVAAGDITTEALSSGAQVYLNATSGAIKTKEINSGLNSTAANVLLLAAGDIRTDSIDTNGDIDSRGGIEIRAHTSDGVNTPFVIGGSGNDNGVNGTLKSIVNTLDGFGVYVTNGASGSTGGITVTSASDIDVHSIAGPGAGLLWLDARDGNLILPTGLINADGSAGQKAGGIILLANTVTTADGTKLSASQDSSATAVGHGVVIAASKIMVDGSAGLEIHGDGNASSGASALLLPEGTVNLTSNGDWFAMIWTRTFQNALSTDAPMEVSGSGPITVTANGNNTEVDISGYPVTFSNDGNVTIESKGASNHKIFVGYTGAMVDKSGLSFSGTGDVLIDASGMSGDGGTVQFTVDEASIAKSSFTVKAEGTESGTNGGSIGLQTQELTLDSATTASLSATGDSTGGLINISAQAGTLQFGTAPGAMSSVANATGSNGTGGKITVNGFFTTVADSSNALQAQATGTDGTGGNISLTSIVLSFDGSSSTISVDGAGSGNGGQILLNAFSAINIGTGSDGDIELSAKSTGSGNGGSIEVDSWGGLTVDSSHLSVDAGTDGNGGSITLKGLFSDLTLNGDLHADAGSSSGQGGTVSLSGDNIILPAMANTVLSANGTDSGQGGTISIETTVGGVTIGLANQALSLEAEGGDTGSGGTVNITSADAVTIDAAQILVNPGNGMGSDGFGGTINVQGQADVTVSGDMDASGAGNGWGGFLSLNAGASSALSLNGNLTANGGSGDGSGGFIDLVAGSISLPALSNTTLTANGNGSGTGGSIFVLAFADAVTIGSGNQALEVQAKGNDSGGGGSIDVESVGGITVDSAALDVTAGTDGNGGSITLNAFGSDLTLSGDLHAEGGSSTGNGGNITLSADSIMLPSDANTSIVADGNGDNSKGGTISLTTMSGDITASSADQAFKIEAKSNISGHGGNIEINSAGAVNINGSALNVDAGPSGDGNGGKIDVTGSEIFPTGEFNANGTGLGAGGNISLFVTSETTIELPEGVLMNAKGGDTGDGGRITINSISTPDAYVYLNVDPGANSGDDIDAGGGCTETVCLRARLRPAADPAEPPARTDMDGVVDLNALPCRQWKTTGGKSWPKVWWDCTATQDHPSAIDKVAPALAQENIFDSIRGPLTSTYEVRIYVWASGTAYGAAFVDGDRTDLDGGYTHTVATRNIIIVAPFERGSIGSPDLGDIVTYTDVQMREVAAHEFGHANDIAYDRKSQADADYEAYIARDMHDLDKILDPSLGVEINRNPCGPTVFNDSTTSSDPAPFLGVKNLRTGNDVCVSGALSADWSATLSNSTIFKNMERGLWRDGTNLWAEAYAQTFAYSLVHNLGTRPMNDKVMDNGTTVLTIPIRYFACVRAWAGAVIAGHSKPTATPSSPSGLCTATP